jgi:hypothetical protein
MRSEYTGLNLEGLISAGGGDPFPYQRVSTMTVINQGSYEMIIVGYFLRSKAAGA